MSELERARERVRELRAEQRTHSGQRRSDDVLIDLQAALLDLWRLEVKMLRYRETPWLYSRLSVADLDALRERMKEVADE